MLAGIVVLGAFVARYPVGKIVAVFYDPADPSHAALEFRDGLSLILLGVAVMRLVVAVYASGVMG